MKLINRSLKKTGQFCFRNRFKLSLLIFSGLLLGTFLLYYSNRIVEHETDQFVFDSIKNLPERKVGIVLGTSRYLSNGKINPYFNYRIQAAKLLFFSGKIQYLILSGDNRFISYNEPRAMRKELLRMGIPDSVIFMDFAGFRTLDSVVRGKEVFQLKRFIIISQEFHNRRAVFIARHHGIDAIAFNAEEPPASFTWKVKLREYLARVAMMLDLYILDSSPHFLGKEHLPSAAYAE